MWLTKLNSWARRPFEKYYNTSMERTSVFWTMTLIIWANILVLVKMYHVLPGWSFLTLVALLLALWVHLILQHWRLQKFTFDTSNTITGWLLPDVAISMFTIVLLCNIMVTLVLGMLRHQH